MLLIDLEYPIQAEQFFRLNHLMDFCSTCLSWFPDPHPHNRMLQLMSGSCVVCS